MRNADKIALNEVAQKLAVPVDWLARLINFESHFDPRASNPKSTAKGLIQFVDSTAKQLGFKNSQDLVDKLPMISDQLRFAVFPYLAQFKPFPTQQSLYMSVFYPSYRLVSPDTPFPENVRAVNPKIFSVQDYINRVNRSQFLVDIAPAAGAGTLFFLILLFLIMKQKRGKRHEEKREK